VSSQVGITYKLMMNKKTVSSQCMLHTASHLKKRAQGTVGHNPRQGPFPKSKNVSKFPLTFQHCENILTIIAQEEVQKYHISGIKRMLSTLQNTNALYRPITGNTSTGKDKIWYVKLLCSHHSWEQ
jgi:hypothetical protein